MTDVIICIIKNLYESLIHWLKDSKDWLSPLITSLGFLWLLIKDTVIPIFVKPRLRFKYQNNVPYKRDIIDKITANVIDGTTGVKTITYIRLGITNIGRDAAKDCKFKIIKVDKTTLNDPIVENGQSRVITFLNKTGNKIQRFIGVKSSAGDYVGFPLKWANRTQTDDTFKGETLDIESGETEYINLGYITSPLEADQRDDMFNLLKYHNLSIDILETIPCGNYLFYINCTGSNFRHYNVLIKSEYNRIELIPTERLKFKLLKPKHPLYYF